MSRHLNYSVSNDPLQTLDLWLPSSISGPEPVIFCIYLHGGAWTDPDQDATEGWPLLDYLHRQQTIDGVKIACASINYRLSTTGSGVRHPVHMNDVLKALTFLKQHYDLQNCVLVGHSAGATLAVQVFESFRRDIMAMILFNGIYDLNSLVKEYPEYNSFVSAAFGDRNEDTWISASPTTIVRGYHIKREHLHELVVLAHSHEDELLSFRQEDEFFEVMQLKWGENVHREVIHGKHDDSPKSEEMQRIVLDVVEKMARKVLQIAKDSEMRLPVSTASVKVPASPVKA